MGCLPDLFALKNVRPVIIFHNEVYWRNSCLDVIDIFPQAAVNALILYGIPGVHHTNDFSRRISNDICL